MTNDIPMLAWPQEEGSNHHNFFLADVVFQVPKGLELAFHVATDDIPPFACVLRVFVLLKELVVPGRMAGRDLIDRDMLQHG